MPSYVLPINPAMANLLSQCHSSMHDPIYAVASRWPYHPRDSGTYPVTINETEFHALEQLGHWLISAKGNPDISATDKRLARQLLQQLATLARHSHNPSPRHQQAIYLDEFYRQYMDTALWSSNDESNERGGEPMDRHYNVTHFTAKTRAAMKRDCQKFVAENWDTLQWARAKGLEAGSAGHNFWLSRNGHGANFLDRDELGDLAEQLMDASKKFHEVNLYVHRGHIYSEHG
jgi:hypothetical protein